MLEETGIHSAIKSESELQSITSQILVQIFKGNCYKEESHGDGERKQLPTAHSFVDGILNDFGNSTHMSRMEFERLYEKLKLGGGEHDHEEHEELHEGEHEHEDHKRKKRRRREADDLSDTVIFSFLIYLGSVTE